MHSNPFAIATVSIFSMLFPLGAVAADEGENPVAVNDSLPVRNHEGMFTTRTALDTLDVLLIDISLNDNEWPPAELVYPPEGCLGTSITGNEYVKGSMKISRKGEVLYESGEYDKDAKTGMRLKRRGNGSNTLDKPGYKIKLNKKKDLLFRKEAEPQQPGETDLSGRHDYYVDADKKDKEWLLLGTVAAANRSRFHTSWEIGRILNTKWEPRCEYANVIINGTYCGIFIIAEGVEDSEGRVNISESGFIIENDAYFWKPDEPYFKTEYSHSQFGYTFKAPDLEDFPEAFDRVKAYMEKADEAVHTNVNVADYIDYTSFAKWVIARDLHGMNDAGGGNMFLVKNDLDSLNPTASKLQMGPLWDFDGIYISAPNEWSRVHTYSGFYYKWLFENRDFVKEYISQWEWVKDRVLDGVISFTERLLAENPDINAAREIEREFFPHLFHTIEQDCQDAVDWYTERVPALDALVEQLKVATGVDLVPDSFEGMTISSANGIITVNGLQGGEKISLFDLSGKVMSETSCNANTVNLDRPSGSVVLVRIAKDSASKTFKVI